MAPEDVYSWYPLEHEVREFSVAESSAPYRTQVAGQPVPPPTRPVTVVLANGSVVEIPAEVVEQMSTMHDFDGPIHERVNAAAVAAAERREA